MKIHTYYEAISGFNEQPILDLWQESWSARGWEPVVLGRADAELDPLFSDYLTRIQDLPTVNPRAYETACYLRWLAMSNVSGVMCDYDVLNLGFTPDDALPDAKSNPLTFYEPGGVPSVVAGSAAAYCEVVQLISTYTLKPTDQINSRPHISDMHIVASATHFKRRHTCCQYGQGNLPLRHFSNASTHGKKHMLMEQAWLDFIRPS